MKLGDLVEETDFGQENSLVPTSGPKSLKQVFQDSLNEEYPEINIQEKDAKRIGSFIANLRHGGEVGLVCAGDECQYNGGCELYKTPTGPPIEVKDPKTGQVTIKTQNLAPVGKSCPLQQIVIMETRLRYEREFSDLDTSEGIVQQLIFELCQIAMLEWRANMLLACENQGIIQTIPGAVTPEGRIIWTQEISPLIDILDRLSVRRARILNDAVKTPKEKYKKEKAVGKSEDDSLSRAMAARREKIRQAIVPQIMSRSDEPKK